MARVKIAEIPNIMTSYWDDKLHCVIDVWQSFHNVKLDDLREVLINKILVFAKIKNCDLHIVDNSKAQGAFSRELVSFFQSEVAEHMQLTNISFFLTIVSENSPIANISMRNLQTQQTRKTINFIEANSIQEGVLYIASLKKSVS